VLLIVAFHPERRTVVPAWIAIGVLVSAVYLNGYRLPADHQPLGAAIERPLAFLVYVGNYLSGPLGHHAAAGIAGGAIFLCLAIVTLARHRAEPQEVLPWIAMGLYAGASAATAGIGRVALGSEQALAS